MISQISVALDHSRIRPCARIAPQPPLEAARIWTLQGAAAWDGRGAGSMLSLTAVFSEYSSATSHTDARESI